VLSNYPDIEDPRITRTRNLIFSAFLELLREKGFQNLTVQDITERAGINRVTFYSHFADKYALLDFSIRALFRQEIEKRGFNACHYNVDNLRLLIVAVCEFVSNAHANCPPSESQFKSLIETQVKNQIQELLQMWLEQVGSVADLKTAATAASWSIYGLALQWNQDKSKRKPSAEQFTDQILPLIMVILGDTEKIAHPI
jgi:AcrR family transcriptional regulator